jgi:hypothetical protein
MRLRGAWLSTRFRHFVHFLGQSELSELCSHFCAGFSGFATMNHDPQFHVQLLSGKANTPSKNDTARNRDVDVQSRTLIYNFCESGQIILKEKGKGHEVRRNDI